MNKEYLTEALRRIDGDFFGNENYILHHLKRLYDDIPNSSAKNYADYEAYKVSQGMCIFIAHSWHVETVVLLSKLHIEPEFIIDKINHRDYIRKNILRKEA